MASVDSERSASADSMKKLFLLFCNINKLSREEIKYLKPFFEDGIYSVEDLDWLISFCKENGLSYKELWDLSAAFNVYCSSYYGVVENIQDFLRGKLATLIETSKFNLNIDGRIKGFVRTLKKMDKKINKKASNESNAAEYKKCKWQEIIYNQNVFGDSVSSYVSDFLGFRIIPATESLLKDYLEQKPFDFLFNSFLPSSNDPYNCDVEILYSIRDALYVSIIEQTESMNNDERKDSSHPDVPNPKDYIMEPKDNGYRSIQFPYQFSCLGGVQRKGEIQIRNYLQHLYAEYEHRRYEGKVKSDELLSFYLVCEICSKFFDEKLTNINVSTIVYIYYICLSILESDDSKNAFKNKMCEFCSKNIEFAECFVDFSEQIQNLCIDIIKSTIKFLEKDFDKFDDIGKKITGFCINSSDESIQERIGEIKKELCGNSKRICDSISNLKS